MRVVGNLPKPVYGPRGPTEAEIEAVMNLAAMAPRVVPCGVYRYRNHAEANAAMDAWVAEGMARRHRAIAAGEDILAPLRAAMAGARAGGVDGGMRTGRTIRAARAYVAAVDAALAWLAARIRPRRRR